MPIVLLACLASATTRASAHTFRIEGKELKSGETHKVATGVHTGVFVVLGKPFLVAVHIECTKVWSSSGALEGEGASSGRAEFEACTTTKPANCVAKEPLVVEFKGVLIESAGSIQQLIIPKGETFTTIKLTGVSCELKEEQLEVTGSQVCNLPNISVEAVEHETDCMTSGSRLTAGGQSATCEGSTTGHLEGSPKWSGI